MNKYINILLGFVLAMGLLFSSTGKVWAQEAENSGAADELQLGKDSEDNADENFKAFAQTGTCLEVFPSSIQARRIGRWGLIIISGPNQFQQGEQVDWGTYDIQTIFMLRFPSRIYAIVFIKSNPEEGEFEVVVGGDYGCTGNIAILN